MNIKLTPAQQALLDKVWSGDNPNDSYHRYEDASTDAGSPHYIYDSSVHGTTQAILVEKGLIKVVKPARGWGRLCVATETAESYVSEQAKAAFTKTQQHRAVLEQAKKAFAYLVDSTNPNRLPVEGNTSVRPSEDQIKIIASISSRSFKIYMAYSDFQVGLEMPYMEYKPVYGDYTSENALLNIIRVVGQANAAVHETLFGKGQNPFMSKPE